MEIELDTTKSAAKNADELFQKAKKLEAKSIKAKEILFTEGTGSIGVKDFTIEVVK